MSMLIMWVLDSTCPISWVVSIGRRNTRPKTYLRVFQWLNSFESVDSRKTLPWLGLSNTLKGQVFFEKR